MQVFNNLHAFLWQSQRANNCNTYLIDGPTRILIDPGHTALFEHVEIGLQQLGLQLGDLGLILCTHAHPDHIEAVARLREIPVLFALHPSEWDLVQTFNQRYPQLGLQVEDYAPSFFLTEGHLNVNGIGLDVFHTPGHSPGAICLYWPETKALFSGDLIFKNGLGRTDLPGGDGGLLKKSIQRMAELDIEWLLPGHGEWLAGVSEVKKNFELLQQTYFNYI